MVAYFQTEHGKAVLALQGLTDAFKQVLQERETGNYSGDSLQHCLDLYFEAVPIPPKKLISGDDEALRKYASTGPDEDFRLSYYVVESQRLSRNPTVSRLALATADTLLETVAGNSSLFISDKVTAKIVDAAIDAFAVQHDFDDDGAEIIFRRLLGAVAVSVAREGNSVSDNPAVRALFAAVREAQDTLGADDVAKLVSADGLQTTVQKLLNTIASDPSFLTSDTKLQASIKAVLIKASNAIPDIVDGKQEAILSLVEVVVSEAAKRTTFVLESNGIGAPLAETVLTAMLGTIQGAADGDKLLESLANGKLLGELYKSALSSIAANPDIISSQTGVNSHVAKLISGYADILAKVDPTQFGNQATTQETVSRILSITLGSLASHPGLAGHSDAFGPVMASVMLNTAAGLVKDGLQEQDLVEFIDAAVAAAAENVALLNVGDHFNSVATIWADAISGQGVAALSSPATRLKILRSGILEMARNPVLWKHLNNSGDAEKLVNEIVEALSAGDATVLLSGPVLADSIEAVLKVIVRRADPADLLPDGALKQALLEAVETLKDGSALSIGTDDVAGYLANFIREILEDPNRLSDPVLLAGVVKQALEDQLKMAV